MLILLLNPLLFLKIILFILFVGFMLLCLTAVLMFLYTFLKLSIDVWRDFKNDIKSITQGKH